MANQKISDLTEATNCDGTELVAVVQGGTTKKAPLNTRIKAYFDTLYAPLTSITASFYANTQAGYGSTGTKIPYYTNTPTNTPNGHFTVSNSATNGLSITINTAGIYSVSVSWDTGVQYVGLSLNASATTTDLSALTAAQILAIEYVNGAGEARQASVTRRFAVNDVIRPHAAGVAASTAARCNFICERLS